MLDLFCGVGGAAVGYHRAGFDVVGVDHVPHPNYPFEFIHDDALAVLKTLAGWRYRDKPFAAIYASPPMGVVEETRRLLLATGLPYVLELNEESACQLSLLAEEAA